MPPKRNVTKAWAVVDKKTGNICGYKRHLEIHANYYMARAVLETVEVDGCEMIEVEIRPLKKNKK